jgi:hypothetical protein
MMLRTISAVALPAAVALALASGTADADPTVPDVHYAARSIGNIVETTLDGGTFRIAADQRTVDIRDAAGHALVTLPLSIHDRGLEYPLPHRISANGRVLDVTAVEDPAVARPAPAIAVASPLENQHAMDAFTAQLGVASAIGLLVGTALGALVGLAGIITGPVVIATVVAGAAFGGVIGTLVAGGPTLIIAGIGLIQALTAPPGSTIWNYK